MTRFVTFTTYEDEDPQAMTEAEYRAAGETDWAEWVWQEAPDKASAVMQHAAKMEAYEADCSAGRPAAHTY